MTEKIDSQNLDVIVIGAGPAGGSTARELAKRGRKVLIIERSQEIGEPNYSTAGTPKETIEQFELPQEVISATWDRILFASPNAQAAWTYPQTAGYVLDFAKLRKFLAEDAAKHGAEIMVGTAVEDFIQENGKILGVRYHGALGDGEARAKIIVDATGHTELSNAKLNVNPTPRETLGEAIEYIMTGIPGDLRSTIAFYFGPKFAPRGYAWVFPMNKNDDAKVGVCTFKSLPRDITLGKIQENFIQSFPHFQNMEPIEIHAGAARADGGVKNHVHRNVVLIGDAAHQVNPFLGEGIRHAMEAGRMAAKIINRILENEEINEFKLKLDYEKEWKKKFSVPWRLCYFLSSELSKINDNEWDKLIESFNQMSPQDFYDFGAHYDFKKLLKYPKLLTFPFMNPKVLMKMLK